MSARIIVLEGSNGSGKTTQSLMLKEFLIKNGFKVKLLKSLQRKKVGNIVRNEIKGSTRLSNETICMLMAADLMEEIDNEVKPYMKSYDYIIFDRYYYSTFVYQTLKGVRYEWIKELYRYALNPDLCFVLDIDFDEFMKRVKNKENIYEKDLEFQKKVIGKYRQIKELFPNEDIIILDGKRDKEEIMNHIVNFVLRL